VTHIVLAPGMTEAESCRSPPAWSGRANIPLAAAIVAAARERGMPAPEASDFASVTGKGVTGNVGGRGVVLGSAKLYG
jgi:Cu+-exporting ATPase